MMASILLSMLGGIGRSFPDSRIRSGCGIRFGVRLWQAFTQKAQVVERVQVQVDQLQLVVAHQLGQLLGIKLLEFGTANKGSNSLHRPTITNL